jgi:DNA-binding NarL/FixJ family response regulator
MKKRILIVDDEPLLLEALQREMREFSNEYQVIVTADCSAIAAIVADQKVDRKSVV